ncbi:tetratricopeptide repeat protein [Longimicrobium sp.]|uniref:tetratricopeptide repeat protein n=1 Tax=Longimicrobium sp. TaxID=2029185 RepID=UPI002E35989F|nr:tetratricopeptide repeat protein [Longimicrobium sp.]HEX6040850.1 tetratricopeptide repeat protein [Longimicrobium sp.]
MRRILLSALLVLAAAPAAAQRAGDVPRRPALPAAADSNDARSYMELGERLLNQRPRDAADAFYWAFQLNPTLSDALYGRYTALLMTDPRRLVSYWEGERRTLRRADVQAMDSLYFRALTMDPFLYRRFEAGLFRFYMESWVRQELDASGGMHIPETELQRYVSNAIMDGGPYVQAREAYARGSHEDALRLYADAISKTRRKSGLRADRARLLAHLQSWAPALQEMTQSLEELRREDERDVVYLYESKALMEHGIGLLNERMGNLPAAREAYGRALTEELTYYPAHVRMATLALTEGDTAAAVAEFDLAAQATSEPSVLYAYGAMLTQIGRYDDAARQFERVIGVAPYYAEPYFGLGMVRDAQGNPSGAADAFRQFLSRARQNHGRRPHAEQRLQAIAAEAGGSR